MEASVTLAEIARIAGVGRAAVSNWRRRYQSFPSPSGGTEVSPQFLLDEVEDWLRDHGKLRAVVPAARLWPHFEALSDRNAIARAIATFGHRAFGLARPPAESAVDEGPIAVATDLARTDGAASVFSSLLARWKETFSRQINPVSAELADLMASLGWVVLGTRASLAQVTVYDPACGTGDLLAAAVRKVGLRTGVRVSLVGADRDPVVASLAQTRLSIETRSDHRAKPDRATVDVRCGDSLTGDPHEDVRADLLICDLPFNDRESGYDDLVTDSRWSYGLPPRTEPELAWVEHALARLRPGGVGVLLVPPAVAARRAGRRIRGALVRSGALRAIVALPVGVAAPQAISLHLWIIQAPAQTRTDSIFLCDARGTLGSDRAPTDARVAPNDFERIIDAFTGHQWDPEGSLDRTYQPPRGCMTLPVVELLNDDVDLTPARHIPSDSGAAADLNGLWSRLSDLVDELRTKAEYLAAVKVGDTEPEAARATIGELARAGAITLISGRPLPEIDRRTTSIPAGALEVITVAGLLADDGQRGWLSTQQLVHEADSQVAVATALDVVIVGVERAYRVWVHAGPPVILGPQIHALRLDPKLLDPWFIAGCLRAPDNLRAASSHTSTSSKIDVRKLEVAQLSLGEQQQYGQVLREIEAFATSIDGVAQVGGALSRGLYDRLAAGRLGV